MGSIDIILHLKVFVDCAFIRHTKEEDLVGPNRLKNAEQCPRHLLSSGLAMETSSPSSLKQKMKTDAMVLIAQGKYICI